MNFHFKSIDLLLEAAFNHLADEFDQAWEGARLRSRRRALGPDHGDDRGLFRRRGLHRREAGRLVHLLVDSGLRDAFRSAAVRVERRYHRDLESEIARLVASKKEASHIIGMLTALVDGYWLQALLYPKTFKAKQAVQSCLTWLRQSVENAAKRERSA